MPSIHSRFRALSSFFAHRINDACSQTNRLLETYESGKTQPSNSMKSFDTTACFGIGRIGKSAAEAIQCPSGLRPNGAAVVMSGMRRSKGGSNFMSVLNCSGVSVTVSSCHSAAEMPRLRECCAFQLLIFCVRRDWNTAVRGRERSGS